MPLLTIRHVDPNSYMNFDYTSIQAGKSFYNANHITVTSFDGQTAICHAVDGSAIYTVILRAETASKFSISCDCPQASRPWGCKHKAAAVLAVHNYLKEKAGQEWWYRLSQALESSGAHKPARKVKNKNVVVFRLFKDHSFYGGPIFRLHLYRIKSQDWFGVGALKDLPTRADQNAYLEKDRSWTHYTHDVNTALDYRYKIIARNSIEEKILQLQERKKELVEQLISTDASIFKAMTKEDVQALFSKSK